MYGPEKILQWIESEVKPMRRSRAKTLAHVVSAAMDLRGSGVLALGRTLRCSTSIKHAIKRVWRFFRNPDIEIESIQQCLVNHLQAVGAKRCVVLVDWTEVTHYKTLLVSIPRDGRSLPVWWRTIRKESGEGVQRETEKICLGVLRQLFRFTPELVVVADRGFGNTRWLRDVSKLGMGYVQRISGSVYVENNQYYRSLSDMPVSRGDASKDWGEVALTQESPLPVRLVTTWRGDAKEPWYLVTNLTDIPQEISRLYQRRMWIEEAIRDVKNREWGLGMVPTELSTPERQDRLWAVLALGYFFLSAFGAQAERSGIERQMRHDTGYSRLLHLARLGFWFLRAAEASIPVAIAALNALPP